MSGGLRCPECRRKATSLFQIPGGTYVCLSCVPVSAFATYPGWRQRAEQKLSITKRKQQQLRFKEKENE